MSYSVGQRLGRLTVTQTTQHGVAERVRCDCGTEINVRLEFSFLAPPEEVGEYHARWLLAAEAGRLRYNPSAYPIHGVPNNVADALWRGLLVDAPDGPVLTDLGAHLMAHWEERRAGRSPVPVEPRPVARRAEHRARPVPEPVQDALFPALFPVGDST